MSQTVIEPTNTNEPQATPFDTPVSLDAPVAITEPTAEPQAQPAPTQTEPAKPAAPAESFEDKLNKYMLGESDEDPTADKTKAVAASDSKKDAVTTTEPEAPVAEPVVTQPKPIAAPAARDYAGLSQDEVKVFKGMSNEAYTRLRPIYDQHKKIIEREKEIEQREQTLKTALPKGVFDQDDAYTLAPSYREASQAAQIMKFESDYWAEQLAAVEKGEDWFPLMRNPKTGEYFRGDKKESTPQAKAQILQLMSRAAHQQALAEQQLADVQSNFRVRREALVSGIKSYEKKFFPHFEDQNHKYYPVVKETLAAIPEEFRDHPLAPMLAKAVGTIKALSDNINSLAQAQQTATLAAQNRAKAGPTLSRTNAAATKPAAAAPDPSKMSPEELTKFMMGDG